MICLGHIKIVFKKMKKKPKKLRPTNQTKKSKSGDTQETIFYLRLDYCGLRPIFSKTALSLALFLGFRHIFTAILLFPSKNYKTGESVKHPLVVDFL